MRRLGAWLRADQTQFPVLLIVLLILNGVYVGGGS